MSSAQDNLQEVQAALPGVGWVADESTGRARCRGLSAFRLAHGQCRVEFHAGLMFGTFSDADTYEEAFDKVRMSIERFVSTRNVGNAWEADGVGRLRSMAAAMRRARGGK